MRTLPLLTVGILLASGCGGRERGSIADAMSNPSSESSSTFSGSTPGEEAASSSPTDGSIHDGGEGFDAASSDAGDSGSDASTCIVMSCASDSDCVPVNAAICNPPQDPPVIGSACCRAGICTLNCWSPSDELPACVDAGGSCTYVGSGGPVAPCAEPYPSHPVPDGCAYSDEVCCSPAPSPPVCPGITSFSISPAEVVGSQTASLAVTTVNGGTILWSVTSSCADGGSIGGFFGPDGGADTTDPNVRFSCGTCTGVALITGQAQLNLVPAGGDASTDVCNGAQFTSYSAYVVCELGAATGDN
jgi:hypothetical protein